ncbi:MAG: S8 family serine peptidase [Proteobacteria bacterium]|nr:S8 family serine peptidase [Pseudomonadota bacterium]
MILILLVICFLADHILASEPDSSERPSYAPGELLVKHKRSVRAAATQYYRTQWNISALRTFRVTGVQHVKLPRWMTVQAALEIYLDDPDVEYAEPNYYRRASVTPDDTYFNRLWGLHNTGQYVHGTSGTPDADIDAPEAWDITTGSNDIVIAVVDTGVDYSHPDLSDNMWFNTGETPDNEIDDDGNGYVDDVHGWDFIGNDKDPMDLHGHGTHVTGIAAAKGDNAIGITGVCWTAEIMLLRFLDENGIGTVADEISAIDYAIANGAHIISASFGSDTYSQSEYNAISRANSEGILFIAAAGNDSLNNDTSPFYPASYNLPNIISVGATDQDDNLTWFSNYGPTTVDVGAPGVNIYSTSPGMNYQYMHGTSVATPHVAGLAALIWGYNSSLTHMEIKDIILNGVDIKPSLNGKTFTGGRINALNAFADSRPQAPDGLAATPESGSRINLSWTDNSSSESRFEIERKTGPGGTYSRIANIAADETSYSDTGLSEKTTYYYQVRAINSAGNSAYSNEADATTILAGPSNLSAVDSSTSKINLSWADNSFNELGFKIERKIGTGATYSQIADIAADETSYSDTGLNEATTYYYRVHAYDTAEDSDYSNEASATTDSKSSGGGGGSCFIATAGFGSCVDRNYRLRPSVRLLPPD